MKRKIRHIIYLTIPFLASIMLMLSMASCKGGRQSDADPTDSGVVSDSVAVTDTVAPPPKPGEPGYEFADATEMSAYIRSCADSAKYAAGIIPTVIAYAPEYAGKLIGNSYSRFIVVDKASMRVILYDKFGQVEKAYDMACARNYGTKHKKADSRTPEGFFSVEGRYNSTDWLYTDDNGVTSEKKGQFGPRFIRIKIPTTSQIGIHGTCAPWSIGHRASHGCIRLTNENIMELYGLVEPGMPVIILPGKRDRAVNREEGYHIAYFPTEPKYAMSDAELNEKVKPRKEESTQMRKDTVEESLPSVENATVPSEDPAESNSSVTTAPIDSV